MQVILEVKNEYKNEFFSFLKLLDSKKTKTKTEKLDIETVDKNDTDYQLIQDVKKDRDSKDFREFLKDSY